MTRHTPRYEYRLRPGNSRQIDIREPGGEWRAFAWYETPEEAAERLAHYQRRPALDAQTQEAAK